MPQINKEKQKITTCNWLELEINRFSTDYAHNSSWAQWNIHIHGVRKTHTRGVQIRRSTNNSCSCPGNILGAIGHNCCSVKSNRSLYVAIFWFLFINWKGYSIDSSKMMGDSPEAFYFKPIIIHNSSLDHTKLSVQFQPWNCWGSCWGIDVGPPLFTLLQPEMWTDGLWTGWCDQPLIKQFHDWNQTKILVWSGHDVLITPVNSDIICQHLWLQK